MAKLYFYFSAMNAGKSTTLLQSDHNYRERGMNTLLFTPALDNRHGVGKITSRIGLAQKAIPFDETFNLYDYINSAFKAEKRLVDCVLVDESHFLTKAHVHQLSDIADKLHIPVLCYGLRSDFQGEPFEGSKYLLTLADELCEIKTICHCGRKATMNVRIDGSGKAVTAGNQIEIGGNERYVATCRRHFKQGVTHSDRQIHHDLAEC